MLHPNIKYLYKYREFNEFTLDIIVNNRIFLSSPAKFNDPFDCSINVNDRLSFDDYIQFVKEGGKRQGLEPSIIENKISESKATGQVPEIIQERLKGALNKIDEDNQRIGVLCLSETNKDILMWAHYGDDHKGICIEFERTEENTLGDITRARPIIYSKEYPRFSALDLLSTDAGGLINKLLYTKSCQWSYEQEWRLTTAIGNKLVQIPGKITSIIFGVKTPQANIDIIQKLVANIDIVLKQAKQSSVDFSVIVESNISH
jgi:hypothetical protein